MASLGLVSGVAVGRALKKRLSRDNSGPIMDEYVSRLAQPKPPNDAWHLDTAVHMEVLYLMRAGFKEI